MEHPRALAAQLVRQIEDPGLDRGVVMSLNCLLAESVAASILNCDPFVSWEAVIVTIV